MATHFEVLKHLRPNGGYIAVGENYEGIKFVECEPFTKSDYESAFADVDEIKEKDEIKKTEKRTIAEKKLQALGFTADDLEALGLG